MKNSILLCSISPDEYTIRRNSYGYTLHIPACPAGKRFASAIIDDQMDYKIIYHGLNENEIERIPFPVSAAAIVNDVFTSEELEDKGVFVPAGEIPTEEELAVARKKRRTLLGKWVREGEVLFAKFGSRGIQYIPDYCKRAVTEMGERREWVFDETAVKTECPVCGELLRNLSNGKPPAICKACNSILDPERVAIHAPQTSEIPKRRGRPPKQHESETVTA